MTLKEYFKKYGVVEVGGVYLHLDRIVDKDVWICDYRNSLKGAILKPKRSVLPTLVRVCLPKRPKDMVRNSPIHFKRVNKRGRTIGFAISPYDYGGCNDHNLTSVNIFESKNDCLDCFRSQIEEAIRDIDVEADIISKDLGRKRNKLLDYLYM